MADKSVFDDWNDVVNCNECARYWDDSCDGVSKGSTRRCTSFLATRSVVIPEQISALKRAVKSLWWAVVFLTLSVICHYLAPILGW